MIKIVYTPLNTALDSVMERPTSKITTFFPLLRTSLSSLFCLHLVGLISISLCSFLVSGGSRILKGRGSSAVQNVFDCALARTRGRRRMHAKRQKGGFRGTPLEPPRLAIFYSSPTGSFLGDIVLTCMAMPCSI